MLEKLKKFWKMATEGWVGWITYALLGIFLAYATNFVLGLILKTGLPLVVVVSNSMSHFPENGILCGENADNFRGNFNDYWRHCEKSFKPFNITREKFYEFPFRDGLNVGDVAVICGSEKYSIGDIIVFSPPTSKYPIIHRVVMVNEDSSYQTKGDHNSAQLPYELRVEKDWIHGKVVLVIPYIGLIKVFFVRMVGV